MSEPELGPLSSAERDMFMRASTAPMDVIQGEVKTYIDRMIEFAQKNTNWTPPVGFCTVILKDLTAQTGVYEYEDEQGVWWLYGNGAQGSQTTYADLYAFVGPNAFGTDTGGNFFLPDGRGRSLNMCGTNALADLGDNDGVAEASRQAQHTHQESLTVDSHNHTSSTLTVTGAPGVGSLAITPNPHGHSYNEPNTLFALDNTVAATNAVNAIIGGTTGTASLSISGAPDLGTLDVGGSTGSAAPAITGTIGTGTTGDAPAHLFIGSLLVRF